MASLVDRCRLCLGEHDCIHVLSYLDGKTKLLSVLNVIAGVQVSLGSLYEIGQRGGMRHLFYILVLTEH